MVDTTSPSALVPNPTGALAQQLPGYDASHLIDSSEQVLGNYLNMSLQEILQALGIPENPVLNQSQLASQAQTGSGAANPGGVSSLIMPVVQALSTLGSGSFQGFSPPQAFNSTSNTLESATSWMNSAASGVGQGWQGNAANFATQSTQTAAQNGVAISQQAQSLLSNVTQAAGSTGQSRIQLVELIVQFMATLAQLSPGTPYTWPAIMAAAARAISQALQVISALQGALGGNTSAVSAAGSPVNVPQLGYQSAGPSSAPSASAPQFSSGGPISSPGTSVSAGASSAGAGLLSTGTGMLSTGVGALVSGLSSGLGAISSAGTAAGIPAEDGADSSVADGTGAIGTTSAAPVGTTGAKLPGLSSAASGGRGATPVQRLSARPSTDGVGTAEATGAAANTSRATAAGASGSAGGGGMGMAPAAAGRNGGTGTHVSADFLHSTDQGDEIVGDLGSVSPPVLGAVDPRDTQGISL